MKFINTIDDVKKASDRVALPSIDVQHDVMHAIYRRKEGKNMFRGKKFIICIIAAIFLICTVGFTVAKVWELNGPGGSPYKYSLFDKTEASYSQLVDSEWEKVKPGGALAVLRVKDNPTNTVTISLKPLIVDSINQLKEQVGNKFKAPKDILAGYSFSEGQINASIDDSIWDAMLEVGKSSREDVVRVIEPSQNIGSYRMLYKSSKKEIDVALTFNWKWAELSQPDEGQKVVTVTINNFDAIYTDGNGRSEIKWIDSTYGSNILYSIGCPEGNATKDELLQVARSLE